ncbi:MAG: hypothetical protein K1X57_00105 [Gemmataceae bacterium]|nr:hypothetical protein [Gemmataceae bacterium]
MLAIAGWLIWLSRAALVAAFAGMIGWIGYRTAWHIREDLASDNKPDLRDLRAFHPTSWRSWRELPGDLETAFVPRVEGRDIFVRRFSRFKVSRLEVSPTPRVLIGDDGWLYYNHEAEPQTYYLQSDPRLADRLAEWKRAMPEWQTWLAQRNIKLVILVAPNKQSVYPEHLPPLERKRTSATPRDELLAYFKSAGLTACDFRDALIPAKSTGALYFRTDTHWMPAGVKVGYAASARTLGWEPMGPERFRGGPGPTKVGDLQHLLGWWSGDPEPFDHIEVVDPKSKAIRLDQVGDDTARLDYLDARAYERPQFVGPRVLLFHDSFGDGLFAEMLAEHAARLVAIPSNHLDPAVIEREKPDIVILEIVERLFQGIGARRPTDPPRRSMVR